MRTFLLKLQCAFDNTSTSRQWSQTLWNVPFWSSSSYITRIYHLHAPFSMNKSNSYPTQEDIFNIHHRRKSRVMFVYTSTYIFYLNVQMTCRKLLWCLLNLQLYSLVGLNKIIQGLYNLPGTLPSCGSLMTSFQLLHSFMKSGGWLFKGYTRLVSLNKSLLEVDESFEWLYKVWWPMLGIFDIWQIDVIRI